MIWFNYLGYNIVDDSYILDLINLLQSYGKKEELDISLIPYNTDEEKEQILNSYSKPEVIILKKEKSRIRIPIITQSNHMRRLRTENYRIMEKVCREEM